MKEVIKFYKSKVYQTPVIEVLSTKDIFLKLEGNELGIKFDDNSALKKWDQLNEESKFEFLLSEAAKQALIELKFENNVSAIRFALDLPKKKDQTFYILKI